MARKPKLDPVKVAADLVAQDGNLSAVARRYGVSRTAVQNMIARTPALKEVVADAREGMLDDAECALYKAVRDGQAWAVCFYLKTQGKRRGYIEKDDGAQAQDHKPLVVKGGDPDEL